MTVATRIVRVCDQHAERDEEVEGDEWTVSLTPPGGRAATYSVDLCEDDAKPLVALLDYLRELGRPPEGSKRPYKRRTPVPATPEPAAASEASEAPAYACPACDYVGNTATALTSHARRTHGHTLSELRGVTLPALNCPECGREFSNPQGRAAHRRAAHGVRGVTAAAS